MGILNFMIHNFTDCGFLKTREVLHPFRSIIEQVKTGGNRRPMPVWTVIYKYALWISIPLFLISAILLGVCIQTIARLGSKNLIVSMPLAGRQQIEFSQPGTVSLFIEGPLFTTKFAGLSYELVSDNGRPVKASPVWLRTYRTGLSDVKLEIMRFIIPSAGRYTLYVKGLAEGEKGEDQYRLTLMRPHRAKTIGLIAGIVLSAVILIASLVLSILRMTGR